MFPEAHILGGNALLYFDQLSTQILVKAKCGEKFRIFMWMDSNVSRLGRVGLVIVPMYPLRAGEDAPLRQVRYLEPNGILDV